MDHSHVGTAPAARLTNEARFDIRQPDIVAPAIGADRDNAHLTCEMGVSQKPLPYLAAAFCSGGFGAAVSIRAFHFPSSLT